MDNKNFNEFFNILEEAFPAEERRKRNFQKKLLEECPLLRPMTVKKGERLLGFMLNWYLESCVFIENFAIKRECRGQSLGSELINTLKASTKKPIVLEVEPPVDEVTRKRVHFYERLGFKFNDFNYMMPPLNEGDDELPLKIMSYPEKITEGRFVPYKKEIYLDVYGKNSL